VKKIRVFQFPFGGNGGVKHYAMNNWNHLDKNKFSCDFGTVQKTLGFEEEASQSGAGAKYIPCTAEQDPDRFRDEIWKLLYGNYDVVHLHTSYWKSFLVEEAAMACKIPKVIIHSHSAGVDVVDSEQRLKEEKIHMLRRKEFRPSLATDLCACSRMAADWLFGEQIPRSDVKILKNAIEAEKFVFQKAVRDKYRNEMGLSDNFVIGHVGRFVYPKNHKFLMDVFHAASKKIPNARLLLVGEGPLERDVKNQADAYGLADKVIFTGLRNDVHNLMQAMDVFCLPSRFEGFPIVLIEAQASGLPCLASNVITNEVCISEQIKMLPFVIERWTDELIELSKGYKRQNMYEFITSAGYNIQYQIKEIEDLYMS